MKSAKTKTSVLPIVLVLASVTALTSCSKAADALNGSTCTTATSGASSSLITSSSTNVIPVYIADQGTTGSVGYQNEPLVSVTICTPGHTSSSQCQTISNILVDTGSFGLRIFGSAIASNVVLHQQTFTSGSQTLNMAECATFGSGADWGTVETADIILGNQSATNVPMQVINYGYNSIPSTCLQHQPDQDPCAAGFNGIIGVGTFPVDCGADCAGTGSGIPDLYYGCDSSGCFNADSHGNPFTFANSVQVTNPISAFGLNGVSMTLPAISLAGASQVQGTLTLGIAAGNSQTAQTPFSTFNVYPAYSADQILDLTTLFITEGASAYYGSGDPTLVSATNSFIDSGSNGVYVPQITGLINCGDGSGFYCPTTTQTLQANIEGYNATAGHAGTPTSGAYTFYIGDADTLFNSGNSAFSNLGGNGGSSLFDWGLPFFYGKTIYVGLEGKTATFTHVSGGAAQPGPFWAF